MSNATIYHPCLLVMRRVRARVMILCTLHRRLTWANRLFYAIPASHALLLQSLQLGRAESLHV